ncbi:MAG: hypothetical protein AAF225_04650 [Pseudomonadota bacterium]
MATELLTGGLDTAGDQGVGPGPITEIKTTLQNQPHGDDQLVSPAKPQASALSGRSARPPAAFDIGSDQSIGHLRELVAAMQPDKAAAILEAIPVADAAKVLVGLPVPIAVAMLTAMTPEGSAQLTEELAKAPE